MVHQRWGEGGLSWKAGLQGMMAEQTNLMHAG